LSTVRVVAHDQAGAGAVVPVQVLAQHAVVVGLVAPAARLRTICYPSRYMNARNRCQLLLRFVLSYGAAVSAAPDRAGVSAIVAIALHRWIASSAAMAFRSLSRAPSGLEEMILREVVQDCVVDLVVPENRLILFEAQAAQPNADIGPRHFRRASAVCYTSL
jgi:hypothetical protein